MSLRPFPADAIKQIVPEKLKLLRDFLLQLFRCPQLCKVQPLSILTPHDPMPRIIAIGDVHGCADEFEELLNALELDETDRVIQLGDLVNRGPDSHRVLELARIYKVESILGNHEVRLLRYHREGRKDLLKDYDLPTIKQLTSEDWAYLESLPKFKYGADSGLVCVHGGFLPDIPWQKQDIDTITSIQVIDKKGRPAKRSDSPDGTSWANRWSGPPFVVYGHTPNPNVVERPGSIGIDTGCVYGGHLTAYETADQSLVQVRARQAYAHSKRLPDPI
jgi:diadenosine tetraphosphatase ApaH/serine/threonine PP2A family protein phosphatase